MNLEKHFVSDGGNDEHTKYLHSFETVLSLLWLHGDAAVPDLLPVFSPVPSYVSWFGRVTSPDALQRQVDRLKQLDSLGVTSTCVLWKLWSESLRELWS